MGMLSVNANARRPLSFCKSSIAATHSALPSGLNQGGNTEGDARLGGQFNSADPCHTLRQAAATNNAPAVARIRQVTKSTPSVPTPLSVSKHNPANLSTVADQILASLHNGTELAGALFSDVIGYSAVEVFHELFTIYEITIYETKSSHVNLTSPKSLSRYDQRPGTLVAFLSLRPARNPVRYVMLYEVLISATIAMVLLPFNFLVAAELVLLLGLPTIVWELRRYKLDQLT
jgi:hypothetical protein